MLRAVLILILALSALSASPARATEYVRDEIRINMRAGPGLQFKILKLLTSGEAVTRLATEEDWIQIRTAEAQVGWVPTGYLSKEPPPSVTLPRVQAKLTHAESRIEALESKLALQTEAIAELDALRERNQFLEAENSRLGIAHSWRWMATGAAILCLGALVGLIMPRGVANRNRLKL